MNLSKSGLVYEKSRSGQNTIAIEIQVIFEKIYFRKY